MRFLPAVLLTFLFGLAFTLGVRAWARRFGMIAAPRKDRWHQQPAALYGGVAIFAAFMLGFLLLGPRQSPVYAVILPATFLFLSGLLDDYIQMKPYTKLVMQLIAAVVAVYLGLRLPWTGSIAVNDLLTIFWLIAIPNAINLLDNMDGLAAGITVISCAFLFVTFLICGQPEEAMVAALLSGAAGGFLVFNFNRASIFMGDCGSMFLGFMLGGTALLSSYGRSRHLTAVLLAPVLILLIPILDTCFVTITRKLSGRAILQGGKDHTSHRLVSLGMSERRAVAVLYLLAIVSGSLALLVRVLRIEEILLLVPLFVVVMLFVGVYLGKVRIKEEARASNDNTIIRALVGFEYKRRVVEVLLDVVLVSLAYYAAYWLRFDGEMPDQQLQIFIRTLPLVVVAEIVFFLLGGMYRGVWRYTGVSDIVAIARAVLLAAAAGTLSVFALYRWSGPSRAVFMLNCLLLFMLLSASRLSFRLIRVFLTSQLPARPGARRILIYGAGDGGELLIREITNNQEHCYAPVGFIDDDARKAGKLIHGYRIFNSDQLPDLIDKHGVSEVLVSSFKVPESRMNKVRGLGVQLKRMRIEFD
jgi:UDP-GlcNAc:undecaprenyl-phosphate GlcNAc-1-phosphate transferase